jgi:hypothetical protein
MYPVPSHFCCSFLGTISNCLSYQPLSRRRHNRSVLRRKALLLSAAAIALAGTGAGVVLATHGGSARAVRTTGDMPGEASQASGKKTYAQLVAANYKILKPQQSTRLVRYADAAFACMSQDLELGKRGRRPRRS